MFFGVLVDKGERDRTDKNEVGIDFLKIGISGKARVRDLWARKDLGVFEGRFSQQLPPHAAGLYRISPLQSGDAHPNGNPAIQGYFADPDILFSEQDQKYYLYPTSDGYDGWSGKQFRAFSSDNLTEWNDEGIILDLTRDVRWADRNAWAPCIIEKKTGDQYRYFYYFTAAQKIGVAVAKHPAGPFVDSGKPVIDFKPNGVRGGQEIDPEVFHDPKSGKDFLYWGNGYMAVAELTGEMTAIKPDTVKIMTPPETYREGTTVFFP